MRNMTVSPQFITAGEATFTVSNKRGGHFTYHIYAGKPEGGHTDDVRFAKVLAGPDNADFNSYKYLGMIILPKSKDGDPRLVITKRSTWRNPNTSAFKVLQWALRAIWQVERGTYTLPETHSIKNIGKCGRCGHPLTNPASLDTGLGPECAALLGVPHEEHTPEPAGNSYELNFRGTNPTAAASLGAFSDR